MEHGADPHRVDLEDLFNSYSAEQWERFQALGVDLTAHHSLAKALGYHTSNKPPSGFAKRHREKNPKIQNELNIALAHHASEANENGVYSVSGQVLIDTLVFLSLRWGRNDDGDADEGDGSSAIYEACDRPSGACNVSQQRCQL